MPNSGAISSQSAISLLDTLIPPTGNAGYLCLLDATLWSSTVTVSTANDNLTTPSAHNRTAAHTGMRVRFSGTVPTASPAINTSTDYFLITTGTGTSSTELRLARTLADAQAGTFIDFTGAGSGLTITEQPLDIEDPIALLISHELSTAGYQRTLYANAGNSVASRFANPSTGATEWQIRKPGFVFGFTQTVDIVYRHVLLLGGASATIGSTTGTKLLMTTERASSSFTANPSSVTLPLASPSGISFQPFFSPGMNN
jgi:hypothetical protein